jgi:hypothetical protein
MDRKKGIGGSDAYQICKGNWHELWNVKTGRKEPEDLSRILKVQVGIVTEPVNVKFLEYELEKKITRDITLDQKEFVMSHLDGITEDGIPVECKHTHERSNMEIVAENYYPQLQHYIWHYNQNSIDKKHKWKTVDHIILSVIYGNSKFEYTVIDTDVEFQKELMRKETAFWKFVEDDIEPKGFDTIVPIPKNIKLDGMSKINMSGNIIWRDTAKLFITTLPFVKDNNNAKKTLKKLVPDDCYKAESDGVTIVRDKRGYLKAAETKETNLEENND